MRWQSQADLIWEEGFNHAKAYFEETGAADAPFAYVAPDGYKLGLFLSKCREKYAKGRLSEERISRLNSINMVWNKSRKNDWDTCFEHIKNYFFENGSLNIPPDYKADGIWLNKWLNEQKQIILGKRPGKSLSDEQIKKLQSVGFTVNDKRDEVWLQKYCELKRYYEQNSGYKNNKNLNIWINNQRLAYKKGKMSEQRIELLNQIGFRF